MELLWGHLFWEKRHRAVIVIAPMTAENPALGVHLRIEWGVRQRGKDQRKSGLQAVFNGKRSDLVENRGGFFIESDDEGTHDTDFAFV